MGGDAAADFGSGGERGGKGEKVKAGSATGWNGMGPIRVAGRSAGRRICSEAKFDRMSCRRLEDQTACFPPTPHDSSGHDDRLSRLQSTLGPLACRAARTDQRNATQRNAAIMPPKANTHFLGIQLAVDHLRAAVVDEQLEVIGADQIDFDNDFPEYQ